MATAPLPVMRFSEPTEPPDFMIATTNIIPVARGSHEIDHVAVEAELNTPPAKAKSFAIPLVVFAAAFAAMGIAIFLLLGRS